MDLETEDPGSYTAWPRTSLTTPGPVGKRSPRRARESGPPLFGQRHHLGPGLPLGVRGVPSYEDTLGLLTHASVFRKCPIYCDGLDPSLVTQETWGLALALPRTSYSELRHVLLCVAPALDLGYVNSLCDPASLRLTQFHGHFSVFAKCSLFESNSS